MTIIAAQFSVGITALAAIETSISEPMHTEIVEDDLEKEELEENSGTFENIDTPDEGELEERRIQKEAVNNRGIDLNVRQNTLEIRVPLGSSDEGIKYRIKSSISVTANGEYLYFEDYDVEDIKLSTNVDVISEGGTIDCH